MSKVIGQQTNFSGGISFSDKEGVANSVAFLRGTDHRSDPKGITLNPESLKDSGSVVDGLPMWGARACTRTFSYDNNGAIYQKTTGAWSKVHTASDSQGNGLAYFTADRALYYTQNTTFGRLLDACTGASFYDDVLGSEGGDPTNTKSILFVRDSSQYASRADTSSTSITADLTIEAYIKPTTLPDTDEIYTIVSKWEEQNDDRSYKLDITTSANFFGDGRDGALTISSNTTEAPVDANCTGTEGAYTLTTSNEHASFSSLAQGDKVVIHQTRGTNAGARQFATVQSYSSNTLTLQEPLEFSPLHSATASDANKAQVRLLKQHTTVTINSGITYTCKAWDGLKGGIIGWYSSGTFTNSGSLNLQGKGFRGGPGINLGSASGRGEGTGGAATATGDVANPNGNRNGNGGGSSRGGSYHATGAGGGNGTEGAAGQGNTYTFVGQGGTTSGSNNLTTISLGGAAAGISGGAQSLSGANGSGIGFIFSKDVDTSGGTIDLDGDDGTDHTIATGSGASGGAGGSLHVKSQTVNLGTSKVTANGGTGGTRSGSTSVNGVNGGSGRIHVDYLTSVAGTTSPNYTSSQDATLGSSDGYVLRLLISSTGANSETYSTDITDLIDTSSWIRWAVSWENSTSTAKFYRNGTLIDTKTGALTAIDDNASPFAVNASFDASGNAENFGDWLMDDVRVWNDVRTASELMTNNDQVLFGTEANQVAYYEFESGVTDSQTSGNNDLTAQNSPTYSNDVPFSGITTRNDQDQGLTSGSFVNSYTLPTAINEGATHRQTFVPAKDPQKSVILDIDTVGTGDWTVTIHDSLNREVASVTVVNAELYTGFYEFVFDSVWRPIIGASYHIHVTDTTGDGALDTTGSSDLETAYFTTHYQFLVSDEYHPVKEFLDFLVMGNERYLAKYEAGNTYDPHRLTFPSGYRVRCLAYWREFLVIGCWKGTNITDFDDGRLFFWDGTSSTYNHSIPVPEGGVNAMFGTQDVLFLVAGYTGEILVYNGGGSAVKFNKIPKLVQGEYVETAPGSMDMWRSNIHMGVSLNTDSETVHKGVYSIGSANSAYPPSLGLDFPTSLGDQTSSSVKIGMVYPSGQELLVGWENGNTHGIDAINPTNDPQPDGTVELLISDLGQISKEKYPLKIRADFEPLESGESIRVKYKSDRETVWKTKVESGQEVYEDTTGATSTFMDVPERMKEIQVACDLRTTASTSPKLLGITVVSEMEQSSGRNE